MRKIITFVFVLMSVTLSAQTILQQDTTIRCGRLANGLTYFLRHNAHTAGQADFYLANRVGAILETPEQRGLAHFLEHIAFNGTKHFPYGNGEEGSIRSWCESKGIKFGADLNASTGVEETIYNISNAPISKAGVADTCLLILRDWSCGLLLRPDEIDQERGVIREEWRTRRSNFAVTRMMEDAMSTIYRGSKYEDCLPIGHIEVIDTFHHESLRQYYRDWYRPDLQAVIVVGDINVDSVEAQIRSLFNQPAVQGPERPQYTIPDNDTMIVYAAADAEQPTFNLSLYMKRDAEPTLTRQQYAEDYMSRLVMFMLRKRLQELTRQSPVRVMTANCRDGAFYVSSARDAFALTMGLLPAAPQEGIDAVIEVVEKARRYGFTEAELVHAKQQLAVGLNHDLLNKHHTRNATYAHSIVEHFCNDEPLLDIQYKAALEAELARSVTLDEVNRVSQQIISNQNQVCIAYAPLYYGSDNNNERIAYAMPSNDQLRGWIEQAQRRHYDNDLSATEVDTVFMHTLPASGTILATKTSTNGYTEYLLSNGIRVHARPSMLEPNRLTLNMFRLGGHALCDEADAATLALLNSVVRESGAADFDYLTLERKRRGKALRVVPYISSEDEGVKGVCASGELETWMQIAHLYLTSPRVDTTIFNSIMQRQRTLLSQRTANPNVIYADSLRLAIYGDNAFTQPMTLERLDEVDLQRMYDIYRQHTSDLSGMNLLVTGYIPDDTFEAMLCTYIASLPGSQPNAEQIADFLANDDTQTLQMPASATSPLDIRPVNENHIFSVNRATPVATTTIVYSVPIPFTAEADLKASVLAQILRAVYTESIREAEGGTYGVSVESQMWRFPSNGCSLTVNFRCDPERFDTLLPLVEGALVQMAEQGPTDEQLGRVVEYERKTYERAIQTNDYWQYVRYHQLHDGVNFASNYLDTLASITPDDIRDFCRQLLSSNQRILVTSK